MNEHIIFIVLFCAMFFFHELCHVVYAKFTGTFKRFAVFRLFHLSSEIPQKGIWKLPIGVGAETNIEKETLHQRVFNCLYGTLGGLPFLLIGWLVLPNFAVCILATSYLIGFSVDSVTVFQIGVVSMKKGWKTKLVDVA